MAKLDKYQGKRNFDITPEPAGTAASPGNGEAGGLFVVHKHAASHLHYDLRLEHEGVLESWAVPKGPSTKAGEKRLAIHVEDHPLEYGEFEGTISKDEYGGGTVMLWDRGHWHQTRRSKGRIDFELEGHKLRGAWTLTRMGSGKGSNGKDQWLLIKRSDGKTPPAGLAPVARDRSVATYRTMKQIERGEKPARQQEPPAPSLTVEDVKGARAAELPDSPRPQLAILADAVPEGGGWIHEIKFDGYRIMAAMKNGRVRLISRNGKDWTERFPEIAGELAKLPAETALLDGEVVALARDGTSSFRALQEALSARRTGTLVYQAFDLVHLDGHDLTEAALLDRKRVLADLMERAGFVGSASVRYTDHLAGQGDALYQRACGLGLEGIICKREDARYRQRRNRQWLKVKCSRHEELLIAGFTDPGGARKGFGALLLGAWDQRGRLIYAGKVGTGFSDRQLTDLRRQLDKLEMDECLLHDCPEGKGAHWVRPQLVAEVEFTEWTRDGMLRHPAFRGLREDKNPQEIRMPREARQASQAEGSRTRSNRKAASNGTSDESRVAGVRLTHPDRVLFPEQGATKLALASYYEEVADWILPQLRRRPLALLRCPQGRAKQCFFQKHPGQAMADDIPKVKIREKEGHAIYLYVEELKDLIHLVQAGTLELHVWGSRVDDLEHPDILVFDLDPGEDVDWRAVIQEARDLRQRLTDLGLTSFVRTTGGKGLHLVVPLKPSLDWDAVKAFCRGVAQAHARDNSSRVTANMSKAKRKGRIFLDYLRNGRGATAVCSYSTRARVGAPVAVPVRWDELSPALVSDRYDVDNLRRRLTALKSDPWQGFDKARRPLTNKMLEAVGVREGNR